MLATALRERRATHESGHCLACLIYGLPVVLVTIEDDRPHLLRDRFRRERSSATEALAIVCLSGPAAETMFFGAANDGSDQGDLDMARRYLRACFPDTEIERQMYCMQLAAERLVRSSRRQIVVIADAVMRHGTLTGDEIIAQLNGATASWLR